MPVTIDRESAVVTLELDFDDLNLLTPPRMRAIRRAFRRVPADASVVRITGGEGLTAGLDISEAVEYDTEDARKMFDDLYAAIEAVRNCPAVTFCDCGEYALGAGFEIALASDFRVAAEDAALGLPEVEVGVPTVIHGGLLVRHVGLGRAKELIYTGETLSGDAALESELIHRTGDGAELLASLTAKSSDILRYQKRAFRRWRSAGVEAGVEASAAEGALAFGTDAQSDAMSAFLDGDE